MEEKKMTDEKIVAKYIEEYEKYKKHGIVFKTVPTELVIDLILRLQRESETLKTELANELEEHKQFVKLAKQIDEGQKAEIERLKRENEYLDMCGKQFHADYEKVQEQVEELLEELDCYKCANRELTSTNEMLKKYRKQDAKDTAKEIWDDCIDKIMRGCGDDKEFWVVEILVETFKKYSVGFSVEVE